MKKFILSSLAALAMSSVASAAFTLCGTAQTYTGGAGASTVTCAGLDAGAGNIITSVQLMVGGDASFVLAAPAQVTISFAPQGSGAGFAPITPFVLTGNVLNGGLTASPTSPAVVGTSLTPNSQTFAGFNVDITSVVNSGAVASSSGTVLIMYTTAPVQTPGVPEPSTFALLGAALTGLGVYARRRKA